MAWTLLSPYLNPATSSSSSSFPNYSISKKNNIQTINWWRNGRRRERTVIANASEEKDGKDSPAFNPFGFVTDNPSSKGAIQLPESPAEDGNVGQMLYVNIFSL